MQGQIQMLCNALGNQPPAGMPQYPQQTNQGRQARGGQCGQQQNQGQQGQPSGNGGGTNNGGGRNGLYRGNGTGGGTNPGSTFNGGGGSYPTQGTSNPLSPIKKFNNWNYCHTHGGDIYYNHTSATCAQPGVNHQHVATRSNTMGGNNKGLHKTIYQVPLANVPWLCNQPSNPPNTPPPLQCLSALMDHGSLLLSAAVVSRLVMYRTKVLMYHTMVLLVRLTKVRR
jgi:hypothetical protein